MVQTIVYCSNFFLQRASGANHCVLLENYFFESEQILPRLCCDHAISQGDCCDEDRAQPRLITIFLHQSGFSSPSLIQV